MQSFKSGSAIEKAAVAATKIHYNDCLNAPDME